MSYLYLYLSVGLWLEGLYVLAFIYLFFAACSHTVFERGRGGAGAYVLAYFLAGFLAYNFFVASYRNFFVFSFKRVYFDFLKVNAFSVALVGISAYTSSISYVMAHSKNNQQNTINFFMFLLFNVFLFFFVFSKSLVVFFFSYELLLLTSASLIFFGGQNMRVDDTAKYFLVWTQAGSFMVFVAVLCLIFFSGLETFGSAGAINVSSQTRRVASLLLLVGFGIKVPIWPFHLWLTKTHVEASTSFSIFLSGILVKTALFGLYRFYFLLTDMGFDLLLALVVFSIFDMALKFFCQSDLKKMVAMATIVEMNMILVNFLFFFELNQKAGVLFLVFHSAMSAFLFCAVDIIYVTTGSRLVQNIPSLSSYGFAFLAPYIVGILIFLGLPLTIKFYLELLLLFGLLLVNPPLLFIFALANTAFVVFFANCFVSLLFGARVHNLGANVLPKKKIYVLSQLALLLVALSFVY